MRKQRFNEAVLAQSPFYRILEIATQADQRILERTRSRQQLTLGETLFGQRIKHENVVAALLRAQKDSEK